MGLLALITEWDKTKFVQALITLLALVFLPESWREEYQDRK